MRHLFLLAAQKFDANTADQRHKVLILSKSLPIMVNSCYGLLR